MGTHTELAVDSPPAVHEPAPPETVVLAGFAGAFGAGLREVVAADGELSVVEAAAMSDLPTVVAQHRPAAMLLNEAAVGDVMELRRLVVAYPATGVVVGVVELDRVRDHALLAAGARVVVPLTLAERELRVALLLVVRGLVGPPRVAGPAALDRVARLTAREVEVFELLARRRTAREIARALSIAIPTVNSHTRRIYEKLGVRSRAELEARAATLRAGAAPRAETDEPKLSRQRTPFRRRPTRIRNGARPSAIDMRAAMGIARWPRWGE